MGTTTLFLCGDVMTGRGIDQIMRHPVPPRLYEGYVHSAVQYVELAESVSGAIPRRVADGYVWGEALNELARMQPDARIVNLETSVTTSEQPWPDKAVHYRMHPEHVRCLSAAGIDCCVLANNHVLDWGREGLDETLRVLHEAGLHTAGAGPTLAQAEAPAVLGLASGARVLVYAWGMGSSGVPSAWAATEARSGVARLPDLSARSIERIAARVRSDLREGDLVVVSIHWGSNWGYEVSAAEREFAHALIDQARVDVVHGHSSHHVKGVEIYRDRPILYGCGDFLNDYEGIEHDGSFRPDLSLMYFPKFARAALVEFSAIATTVRRFRVQRAAPEGAQDLIEILRPECARLDTEVVQRADGSLAFNPMKRKR